MRRGRSLPPKSPGNGGPGRLFPARYAATEPTARHYAHPLTGSGKTTARGQQ